MPGGDLKTIRKRIQSVKNTQKITRAMKLVAAARLRRAQENIVRMRPYAEETLRMLSSLAARAGEDAEIHPLLARRPPQNVLLIVLTSDRGLAGSFNVSVAKAAFKFYGELKASGSNVTVGTIGRRTGLPTMAVPSRPTTPSTSARWRGRSMWAGQGRCGWSPRAAPT